MITGAISVLVLLFLTPVMFSVSADIATDGNVSATAKTIIDFVPLLYVLGVLVYGAGILLQTEGGQAIRRRFAK